jgi:hypothetical protein
MNQASRGKPFSITLTRRVFRQLHFNHVGISLFNLLRNRPLDVFIEKWVLTPATFQRRRWASSQGALPSATAILRSQRR